MQNVRESAERIDMETMAGSVTSSSSISGVSNILIKSQNQHRKELISARKT